MFMAASNQRKLASKEGLGIALWRTALHAPEPSQAPKGFLVEPLLGALTAEMQHQQLDLALKRGRGNRHVKVGLPDVSVPFGDLVFKNTMVPERVPGQAADLTMILMRVVASMRQNEIRLNPLL